MHARFYLVLAQIHQLIGVSTCQLRRHIVWLKKVFLIIDRAPPRLPSTIFRARDFDLPRLLVNHIIRRSPHFFMVDQTSLEPAPPRW
jgi:hypothetical protein